MIGLISLIIASSVMVDTTEWNKPFSVAFDCRLVSFSSNKAQSVKAKAKFDEGADGSQPFSLNVIQGSKFLHFTEVRQAPSAQSGVIRVSKDDLIVLFPFDQSKKLGSKSYPEMLSVYREAADGNEEILMAGPCKVEVMEISQ